MKQQPQLNYLKNVKNVNDIYDYQTFAFWLLMFSMRGLYPRDFDQMHQHEQIIDCETGSKRYVKHRRSKTGELMNILISCKPLDEIFNALKASIYYTHLEIQKLIQVNGAFFNFLNMKKKIIAMFGMCIPKDQEK